MRDRICAGERLGRAFFARDPEALAADLLGRVLVRRLEDGTRLASRIIETEAYLGVIDRAAHTFGGRRTPRNEAMYGEPGTLYVYFTYGMHHCANVVCGAKDEPVAVLLRGLEPVDGVPTMRAHRGEGIRDTGLCSGPGKLCQAMGIDRNLNHTLLTGSDTVWIEAGEPVDAAAVVRCPRIGIGSAGEWVDRPLRFYLRGNPHVSVKDRSERVSHGGQKVAQTLKRRVRE